MKNIFYQDTSKDYLERDTLKNWPCQDLACVKRVTVVLFSQISFLRFGRTKVLDRDPQRVHGCTLV